MGIATKLKEYVEDGEILTYEIIRDFNLTSETSLKVILSNMVKMKIILSPKKGVYVSKNFNPFKIAPILEPGYITLTTAFYHYNFISEYPFNIYVGAKKWAEYSLGNYKFIYFPTTNFKFINLESKIALPEKAIYDSLKYYKIVPFRKTLEAIHHARKVNWDNFLALLSEEKSSFLQRTGYLFSILPKKNKKIKEVITFCKQNMNKESKIYLFGRSKGTFIEEWNIIDNIREEELLSWWK